MDFGTHLAGWDILQIYNMINDTKNDEVVDDDDIKEEDNVTQGKSQAPTTGKPGSTYEQVDDKGNLKSKTKYGPNGKPEYRDDFDHTHFDKESQQDLKPHRHPFDYNENDLPIKKPVIPIP